MNRRIIILLILIGFFSIVGVSAYSVMNGLLETDQTSEAKSEEVSEVKSEEVSEVESEEVSEVDSESQIDETEVEKDPNEGVETTVPEETTGDETSTEDLYDEHGDLKENSKYLDADGDTVANYYDICPGVDDFSDDCETDAYDTNTASANNDSIDDESVSSENNQDTSSSAYDENGDLRENSTYLDADGDTVANYYDICPGIDDFSDECEEA